MWGPYDSPPSRGRNPSIAGSLTSTKPDLPDDLPVPEHFRYVPLMTLHDAYNSVIWPVQAEDGGRDPRIYMSWIKKFGYLAAGNRCSEDGWIKNSVKDLLTGCVKVMGTA